MFPHIEELHGLPETLLQEVAEYADVQNLLYRFPQGVSFKPALVRQMLLAAKSLYRWIKYHSSAAKLYCDFISSCNHRVDELPFVISNFTNSSIPESLSSHSLDMFSSRNLSSNLHHVSALLDGLDWTVDQDTESEMVLGETEVDGDDGDFRVSDNQIRFASNE